MMKMQNLLMMKHLNKIRKGGILYDSHWLSGDWENHAMQ